MDYAIIIRNVVDAFLVEVLGFVFVLLFFHLIFHQGENVSSRVKAMQGDIDLPGLGLSDADKAILSSQVIVSCDQMCVLFSLSSPQIETASHIHFLFSPF